MPAPRPSARTALCLLALLCSFSGGAGWAQVHTVEINAGARVRITVPDGESRRVTGKVLAMSTDSLVLAEGRGVPIWIPLASVSTLEVSRGQQGSRAKGALIGAGGGLVAGFTLGALCIQACSSGGGANLAPIGGMLVGPPIGAILGAFLLVPERWERIPLPGRISITPGRRQVALSTSFGF